MNAEKPGLRALARATVLSLIITICFLVIENRRSQGQRASPVVWWIWRFPHCQDHTHHEGAKTFESHRHFQWPIAMTQLYVGESKKNTRRGVVEKAQRGKFDEAFGVALRQENESIFRAYEGFICFWYKICFSPPAHQDGGTPGRAGGRISRIKEIQAGIYETPHDT